MRRLALTLILLFAAPVAAQEAGEPHPQLEEVISANLRGG